MFDRMMNRYVGWIERAFVRVSRRPVAYPLLYVLSVRVLYAQWQLALKIARRFDHD